MKMKKFGWIVALGLVSVLCMGNLALAANDFDMSIKKVGPLSPALQASANAMGKQAKVISMDVSVAPLEATDSCDMYLIANNEIMEATESFSVTVSCTVTVVFTTKGPEGTKKGTVSKYLTPGEYQLDVKEFKNTKPGIYNADVTVSASGTTKKSSSSCRYIVR